MSTPIRYFTDEHVATAIAKGLRKRGIDVLTVSEANLLGTDDEDFWNSFARKSKEPRPSGRGFLRPPPERVFS